MACGVEEESACGESSPVCNFIYKRGVMPTMSTSCLPLQPRSHPASSPSSLQSCLAQPSPSFFWQTNISPVSRLADPLSRCISPSKPSARLSPSPVLLRPARRSSRDRMRDSTGSTPRSVTLASTRTALLCLGWVRTQRARLTRCRFASPGEFSLGVERGERNPVNDRQTELELTRDMQARSDLGRAYRLHGRCAVPAEQGG